MKRDISLLKNHPFDAVVIGGGIHGATIFHQLAAAGLRIALIEKDDFGGGTSANSLKILHSGLRYLQHLNFKRIRESIRSRKYFMQMAPHLITPMPCIMPTYGLGIEGKPVMAIALPLFDIIGCDRNQGAPATNRVGRGRILSRRECLRIGPGIKPEGLTGAALWYDDLIVNTERMTLTFIKEAMRHNAACANYLKAEKIVITDRQVRGVQVADQLTGETFLVQSPLVINAAGPWLADIQRKSLQFPTTEDLAKAVNIVVDKALFPGYGVGLAGTSDYVDQDAALKRSKRLFFFAPWQNRTIIGTTYKYTANQDTDRKVTADDIDELLREVNAIYPPAGLTRQNVIFSHSGLVPAHSPQTQDRSKAAPQVVKHSQVIDHEQQDGVRGIMTIEGVKYTTAPAIACEVERMLAAKKLLAGSTHPCPGPPAVAPTPLPKGTDRRLQPAFPHIEQIYGADCIDIFKIIADDKRRRISLGRSPAAQGRSRASVRQEMAMKLADVVLRRTDCGTTGCPTIQELQEIAGIMADELGWETTAEREVNGVTSYYRDILGIATSLQPSLLRPLSSLAFKSPSRLNYTKARSSLPKRKRASEPVSYLASQRQIYRRKTKARFSR